MDAAERQALFAELERRSAALPQTNGIEVPEIEVPAPLHRRDLLRLGLFALICSCILIPATALSLRWLDADPSPAPFSPEPTNHWDSFFSWKTLVYFAVSTITASLAGLLFRYIKPHASTRKAVAQRISALVVETAPAQAPLRRDGEFTVVLEDEGGDQTLYHADLTLARDLRAGAAGLAVVAHHKLLAFQPLGA